MLKVHQLTGGYAGESIVKNMTFHVKKARFLVFSVQMVVGNRHY